MILFSVASKIGDVLIPCIKIEVFLCPKLLSLENPFEFIWNHKSSFEIWKLIFNLKFFILFENSYLEIKDWDEKFNIHWKCYFNREKKLKKWTFQNFWTHFGGFTLETVLGIHDPAFHNYLLESKIKKCGDLLYCK